MHRTTYGILIRIVFNGPVKHKPSPTLPKKCNCNWEEWQTKRKFEKKKPPKLMKIKNIWKKKPNKEEKKNDQVKKEMIRFFLTIIFNTNATFFVWTSLTRRCYYYTLIHLNQFPSLCCLLRPIYSLRSIIFEPLRWSVVNIIRWFIHTIFLNFVFIATFLAPVTFDHPNVYYCIG